MIQEIKDRALDLRLYDVVQMSAKRFPNKDAVGFVGQKMLSYTDFINKVDKLAYHMDSHGVKQHETVAIWSENHPNWLIAYFAIMKIGAVAVPILPDFSALEVQNILEHSGTKAIFVSTTQFRKLSENSKTHLETLILLNDFSIRTRHIGDDHAVKGEQFEAFCKKHENEIHDMEAAKGSNEDLASIIYTSGTTGSSKGVMLTHKNLVTNVRMGDDMFNIKEGYRCLSILTMSHTLEFTLGNILTLSSGAAVYYIDKPPTASVLLPALKQVKPHFMLTVPLIIEKIFKAKVKPALTSSPVKRFLYSISPVKKVLHKVAGKKLMQTFGGELVFFGIGGAKLDSEVEQFLLDAGFPYAIGYGLTETAPLLAGAVPGETILGSTGKIAKGVEIKLINIKNGLGEIIVRGTNIMKGYYKNDELTAKVINPEGWFHTGDLAEIDSKNRIFIKGRTKNMILGPSGENIYPEEIEAHINKHAFVLESVVYEIKGKLVARVHLNYEELETRLHELKKSALQIEEEANRILDELLIKVNGDLNKFSKLSLIIEQKVPFEKTPTLKIKRYLYS